MAGAQGLDAGSVRHDGTSIAAPRLRGRLGHGRTLAATACRWQCLEMKCRPLLVALAALSVTAAAVAQRTAPEDPAAISARHLARLRAVFHEAYEPQVLLSAIAYSAAYPEYLVGLRRSGNRYEIFSVRASRAVWGYGQIEMFRSRGWRMGRLRRGGGFDDRSDEEADRIASTLPANPLDLPLSRCAVQVDPPLAEHIRAAWQSRFLQVPAREPSGQAGAEAYIARMGSEEREAFASEWSAGDDSQLRLIELAVSLGNYCDVGRVQGSGLLEALAGPPN